MLSFQAARKLVCLVLTQVATLICLPHIACFRFTPWSRKYNYAITKLHLKEPPSPDLRGKDLVRVNALCVDGAGTEI